ncbi:MAG: alpha/beta hydrolase [Rhodocyclaceae bacterium]|nr:alpha/beta hydrolase [Rhodocyclaceae bacterium]
MIVFVHGAGNDRQAWHRQCAYFADAGRRLLAPDLPGHGGSHESPLTTIEAMADWLGAQLAQHASDPVALVGHSMGSLIALEAAARGAARVASLTLVGSTLPMRVAPALLEAARSDPAQARQMINDWSFAGQAGAGGAGREQARADNLAMMARQPAGVLAIDLGACDAYTGGPAAAAALRCPTWLVCGDSDRMTPLAGIGVLHEALRGSGREPQIATIADCGHAIMAEQPERLNETLARCCEE